MLKKKWKMGKNLTMVKWMRNRVDVRKQIREEAANTNESFLDVYKGNVIFAKSHMRDDTHQKVMETFTKAQQEVSNYLRVSIR